MATDTTSDRWVANPWSKGRNPSCSELTEGKQENLDISHLYPSSIQAQEDLEGDTVHSGLVWKGKQQDLFCKPVSFVLTQNDLVV